MVKVGEIDVAPFDVIDFLNTFSRRTSYWVPITQNLDVAIIKRHGRKPYDA